MELTYQVATTLHETKIVSIEREDFISVEHMENGSIMWTAFIGKEEGRNDKKSIKISPIGGVFEVKKMYGGALLNAEILLKKDSFNKVLPNSQFIELYNKQKGILVVDFSKRFIITYKSDFTERELFWETKAGNGVDAVDLFWGTHDPLCEIVSVNEMDT